MRFSLFKLLFEQLTKIKDKNILRKLKPEKYILLLKIETKINVIKIISLITNLVFDNTDYKNTMLVHYPGIIS